MSNQSSIEHEGVIDRYDDGIAKVKIISQSACASCHAKGACSASDEEEKFLDIPSSGIEFKTGERVRIMVARRLGLKAVAMGYIYPFILLMIVLFSLSLAGVDDLKAGLIALFSLLPYYLILFLLRGRLESQFTFTVQKTQPAT